MKKVEIGLAAESDIESATILYHANTQGVVDRFLEGLHETMIEIREHPLAGTPIFDNYRRRLVRQFPYSVVYRVEDNKIVIIAVMHQ